MKSLGQRLVNKPPWTLEILRLWGNVIYHFGALKGMRDYQKVGRKPDNVHHFKMEKGIEQKYLHIYKFDFQTMKSFRTNFSMSKSYIYKEHNLLD